VGIAWVGFDQPKKLGANETGSAAALPIWIGYMAKALKGAPDMFMTVPEGVISARVNESGLRSSDGKPEFFYRENPPPEQGLADPRSPAADEVRNQLF
jgi:penicillin-binding protein 1A